MEANGVTPMPAPTHTAASYLKISILAVPNGPSTATLEWNNVLKCVNKPGLKKR